MTGSTNGLSLILNVEQYEYMRGPQSDAGVKVSIHTGNICQPQGIFNGMPTTRFPISESSFIAKFEFILVLSSKVYVKRVSICLGPVLRDGVLY